jgi:hypothetical protein
VSPVEPITIERLARRLADDILTGSGDGPARVIVDGPIWAGVDLLDPLAHALELHGRESVVVQAGDFLRPASLRYEHGRLDAQAFADDWIDVEGLRRELLDPLGPGGSRRYLPSLWDAERDRATRAPYRTATDRTVVLLRGWLLLGRAFPAELTVHLALSAAARRRRVPPDVADRELPAFDRYDATVRPAEAADVVVRCDDPRHLAVSGLRPGPGTR